MPGGIEFVASWVTADLGRVFQVMECDDVTLLQGWVAAWEDLADFEIVPVAPGGRAVADAVQRGCLAEPRPRPDAGRGVHAHGCGYTCAISRTWVRRKL